MYRTGYSEAAKSEYVANAVCAINQYIKADKSELDDDLYVYNLSGELCLRFNGNIPDESRLASGFYVVVSRKTGEA